MMTVVEAEDEIVESLKRAQEQLQETMRFVVTAAGDLQDLARVEKGLEAAVQALEGYGRTFDQIGQQLDQAKGVMISYREAIEAAGGSVVINVP
jgi:hypothetical protein